MNGIAHATKMQEREFNYYNSPTFFWDGALRICYRHLKNITLFFFFNVRQAYISGVDCGGGFDSCDNNDFSSIKAQTPTDVRWVGGCFRGERCHLEDREDREGSLR